MTDLVQRPTKGQEKSRRQQVKGVQERKPSEKGQQWAIGQARVHEATQEELESQIRAEVGMNEWCEAIDQPVWNTAFLDMSGPLPDDDFYDFGEYGEDNPVSDPDKPSHLRPSWEKNDFDALNADNNLEPLPDIIIDEFGNVEIPREELLQTYYGRLPGESYPLSQKGMQVLTTAQMLRAVGEALVEKEGDLILSGETDFSNVTLLPLTQKELMEPLSITDKSTRTRITDRYIKTPHWGVLHLSVFFPGVDEEWRAVAGYVRQLLKGEDLSNPYPNKVLWDDIQKKFSLSYKNNRQFRNELVKVGIPLRKSRKDIYDSTRKWKEKKKVQRVNFSDISKIRGDLQHNYGLFNTTQTKPCRAKQYIPFVEDRITAVLKGLEVEVR
jgi:hypothetical protein|tara:strand:- start:1034 stop:2182 length:1149 start_codon:yes stop_codon:yes gene_type:complete